MCFSIYISVCVHFTCTNHPLNADVGGVYLSGELLYSLRGVFIRIWVHVGLDPREWDLIGKKHKHRECITVHCLFKMDCEKRFQLTMQLSYNLTHSSLCFVNQILFLNYSKCRHKTFLCKVCLHENLALKSNTED